MVTLSQWTELARAAEPIVLAALGAASVWLSAQLNRYVKSRRLATALDTLQKAAMAAVATVYQQLVKELKDPTRAGSWNRATAVDAKAMATQGIRAVLAGVLDELPALGVADVDTLLSQLVENAVVALNAKVPTPLVLNGHASKATPEGGQS